MGCRKDTRSACELQLCKITDKHCASNETNNYLIEQFVTPSSVEQIIYHEPDFKCHTKH